MTSIVWQLVIHAAYDEQKVLYDRITQASEQFMVCQHDADDKVNRTHCHVLIENPKRTVQTLRSWIHEAGCGGRGNYAIFSNYTRDDLGVYMVKGDKAHVKVTSFTDEQVRLWEQQWVNREKKLESPDSAKLPGVKTQWEIMSEILAETRAAPGVWEKLSEITTGDDGLIPEAVWICKNHRFVWNIMLKHLAINKIRTSSHELERWYVTMMRESRETSDAIFKKIYEKLY